ncbi:MAG TPA: TonB-dependent receptor plug domain-containing protein, partial [Polyangiales bacterium]|nr:TonB-dependent receptor plug domain-containing protein [Polyangiales bacterium]
MRLETLLVLFTLCAALCSEGTARAQIDGGVATDVETTDAGAVLVSDAGRPPAEYSAVAAATRLARPLRQVSAAVTVISRAELDQNPALSSDSVLRSVPSLATFRRSTSLTADPSAQGLNLRGVGPSGVSRSLVLLDGVPV